MNLTDNEIVRAFECCHIEKQNCIDCPAIANGTDCVNIEKLFVDVFNRLQADKEALIAGQETLQKALAEKVAEYEALKADEEREHQYCKNVCEPKYKAKVADERAKGNICAEVIARQDKDIARLHNILLSFMKEVEKWENKHGLDISELPLIPIKGESVKIKEQIKAEAIKECLDWVLSLFPEDRNFTTISRFTVKQKLKEMVGNAE